MTTDQQTTRWTVESSQVIDLMTTLFWTDSVEPKPIIAAGLVTPDVQLAAHHANRQISERAIAAPLSSDIADIVGNLNGPEDIIYLSNPNQVTGTIWSLDEIATLAAAVPFGKLIVEESYRGFSGMSAASLVSCFDNLIVIGPSDPSSLPVESWLVESRIEKFESMIPSSAVSESAEPTVSQGRNFCEHLRTFHTESLTISQALVELGVSHHCCPTDFLLIKVADPTAVGNYLSTHRVPIENLDGYPGMKGYLRYHIHGRETNQRMLRAFSEIEQSLLTVSRQTTETASPVIA
jgi:histidinol-phosphate/aromatic aminotransferase/cobyric acid decarboxylase-like protein